jgi:folate-binding protein YgfZ
VSAYEALRIARGEAWLGLDTDHRTIPNEMGWISSAVHLDKGCYRGQVTIARCTPWAGPRAG